MIQHLEFAPPFVIDLETLQLAWVDSANACAAYDPAETGDIYDAQLVDVLSRLDPERNAWLFTHRPVWGVALFEDKAGAGCSDAAPSVEMTAMLQSAFKVAQGAGALVPQLVLSGHMHLFQSLAACDSKPGAAANPPQLIVGISGVHLEVGPAQGPIGALIGNDAIEGMSLSEFGFLSISSYSPDGSWKGLGMDKTGETVLARCEMPADGTAPCLPP